MHKALYASFTGRISNRFSTCLVDIVKSLTPRFKEYSDKINYHFSAVYGSSDLIRASDIRRPRNYLTGVTKNF